jgi:hypothetical protein
MDLIRLNEIATILNTGALNYTVFLKSFDIPLTRPLPSEVLIRQALGEAATVGGIEKVQSASVWPEVQEALLYAGEPGAGPSAIMLTSEAFAASMKMLEHTIGELAGTAAEIESFWLRKGHPAYPVFWDFAFIFKANTRATILIGSSSD